MYRSRTLLDAATLDYERIKGRDLGLEQSEIRKTWVWFYAGLAAASAIAQLAVTGPGRLALLALSIAALLRLLLAAINKVAMSSKNLRAELIRYRRVLHRALNYVSTGVFERRVEITLYIGTRDGEDSVAETHWTRATPSLLYRTIKPITANSGRATTYRELRLQAYANASTVDITPMLLVEGTDGVIVLLVFQPETSTEVEWRVKYDTPRLWGTLRTGVEDYLSWTPSARHPFGQPVNADEAVFHFVFPASMKHIDVRETNGHGRLSETEELSTGQRSITWRDDTALGKSYRWALFGK